MMKKILDGNKAVADVAYLFSEVASIYPITPSSPMATEIDIVSQSGKKNVLGGNVQVVEMQSEAGAAGALHGALITGSLASTYTASQGLLLMIPNMYKIAGECLPGVIHVAARTVATHALSIFGDHSDIYAVRQTGFCMLSSSSVRDANYLSAVAHLSAIEGSLPFVHFFDGFRTSHEINTIDEIDEEEIKKLVSFDKIREFKERSLVGKDKVQKGMAENEDIYFQSLEARNSLYLEMPDIVNDYMKKINALTGQDYRPFNYYGAKDAVNVIVAMGSVCDTARLVVDEELKKGEKIGLIEVHLYRPFSVKYLIDVLPASVKNIAVLDRTKEAGGVGEPLYLDVCAALKEKNVKIVGGRYGLASKNTTPSHIYSVYKMLSAELKDNFTVGIDDDVTNLSLPVVDYEIDLGVREIKTYGFGSDGMVSAGKDIMKIIGSMDGYYVQGYNEYDSKKSGGVTICNMRIGDKPINAPFYVTKPDMVVITKDEYLFKFEMIETMKDGGTLILNTLHEKMNEFLPSKVKELLVKKNIKLYIIKAEEIALLNGIKGKISKIMEFIMLHLLCVKNALELVNEGIEKQFVTKGKEIIEANKKSIKMALDNLVLVSEELTYVENKDIEDKNVFDIIARRLGDKLKVSDLIPFRDGTFPCGLSKQEKRKVSTNVPKWIKENCIECGQCSIVCPHAVIRPIVSSDIDKLEGIPLLGEDGKYFEIVISEADCTSCGLCINVCPGKAGAKALEFGLYDEEIAKRAASLVGLGCEKTKIPKFSIKGSQFEKSKFEFSGACAGCGETPYIKLLTQLFGDKLVIANATGCSSIYGGSVPSTPYLIPWANSLFEDNAEFGYGMLLSYNLARKNIFDIMTSLKDGMTPEVKELFMKWLDNMNDYEITSNVKTELEKIGVPEELKMWTNYIPAKSVWTLGGDGWAYDIGFGGIDHVLSSGEDVNILVLDTEVYSNTGGQASKSSQYGQVAQFADVGKRTIKKDLFKIAMNYPNCYVANVSLGANFMQTINAFKEAEEHKGPSIIIAYSPCIEQGIRGGMSCATNEQKLAVECGYTTLLRYKPEEDKLYIDSREPDFAKYDEFLKNEVRYSSLLKKNPNEAQEILNINKEEAIKRYNSYVEIKKQKE